MHGSMAEKQPYSDRSNVTFFTNAGYVVELQNSTRCLMYQTRVPERSETRWLSQWQAEVRVDHRLT